MISNSGSGGEKGALVILAPAERTMGVTISKSGSGGEKRSGVAGLGSATITLGSCRSLDTRSVAMTSSRSCMCVNVGLLRAGMGAATGATVAGTVAWTCERSSMCVYLGRLRRIEATSWSQDPG